MYKPSYYGSYEYSKENTRRAGPVSDGVLNASVGSQSYTLLERLIRSVLTRKGSAGLLNETAIAWAAQ